MYSRGIFILNLTVYTVDCSAQHTIYFGLVTPKQLSVKEASECVIIRSHIQFVILSLYVTDLQIMMISI